MYLHPHPLGRVGGLEVHHLPRRVDKEYTRDQVACQTVRLQLKHTIKIQINNGSVLLMKAGFHFIPRSALCILNDRNKNMFLQVTCNCCVKGRCFDVPVLGAVF